MNQPQLSIHSTRSAIAAASSTNRSKHGLDEPGLIDFWHSFGIAECLERILWTREPSIGQTP
jgi:hypothetical protein